MTTGKANGPLIFATAVIDLVHETGLPANHLRKAAHDGDGRTNGAALAALAGDATVASASPEQFYCYNAEKIGRYLGKAGRDGGKSFLDHCRTKGIHAGHSIARGYWWTLKGTFDKPSSLEALKLIDRDRVSNAHSHPGAGGKNGGRKRGRPAGSAQAVPDRAMAPKDLIGD